MDLDKVLDRIDNYLSTIHGLLAFRLAVTWRDENTVSHNCSFGRQMTPSTTESEQAVNNLTPDAVIQIGSDLGYVVEAKRSFPMQQDYWENDIQQLLTYDDNLTGWWTDDETINGMNVVGLIWTTFARPFSQLLSQTVETNQYSFINPTSVIEFSRIGERRPIIRLRKEWGELSDPELEQSWINGISIPLELIVSGNVKPYKFYDDKPPIEYIMAILWNDFFTMMAVDVELDDSTKSKLLEVDVDQLAKELQNHYGSRGLNARDRQFPSSSWIREALDALSSLGLAEPLLNEDGSRSDRFLVKFKTTLRTGESGDLIEKFYKYRSKQPSNDETAPRQMDLI